MSRAFILLFDSFGVGATPDAPPEDRAANTFIHIAERCAPHLPNLTQLGLGQIGEAVTGKTKLPGVTVASKPTGIYGYAEELSFGKDTPSGHWEIAGVPALFDWGYFNTFPDILIDEFIQATGIPGILGNCHASGTEIIQKFGDEHLRTKKLIVYTSADSVFQIAAHESIYPPKQLYEICKIAKRLVEPYNIGRVIARPFIGTSGHYERTPNRKDYAVPPPAPTLLDSVIQQDHEVWAIGKVADIFAHQGITHEILGKDNLDLFDQLLLTTPKAQSGDLVFVNFVDFDSKYGHRRDVAGYARALEALDARLPEFQALLRPGDLAIITADHGCDPTLPGSDHTREFIPILGFGPGVTSKNIGRRKTFADIGQTLATHLELPALKYGTSFLA